VLRTEEPVPFYFCVAHTILIKSSPSCDLKRFIKLNLGKIAQLCVVSATQSLSTVSVQKQSTSLSVSKDSVSSVAVQDSHEMFEDKMTWANLPPEVIDTKLKY